MKELSKQSFEEIRLWIYRNARPLDLALWQYYFENGSKDSVVLAISYYQNIDGGFGNTIEPSGWSAESTPYNVWFVVRILCMIDYTDTTNKVIQGMFRYLENTEYQSDFGWFFITPGRGWDDRIHENDFQSIGITAIISGYILRSADKKSRIYQRAFEYAKMLIEKLPSTKFGDMGIRGYCKLLEDIEGAGMTGEFNYDYLCRKMHEVIWNKIHDRTNEFFMHNPLAFVFSPTSRFYKENKQEVDTALDQIIDQMPTVGVWDIPWNEVSSISENWWKSFEAIAKLAQLKRFG